MLNGFDKDEMNKIFDENLKFYFNSLEQILQVECIKIESESCFKQ
jgi:hypothetical protein